MTRQRVIKGLLLAFLGSQVAIWLALPLPWLMGSLLCVALLSFSGVRLDCPSVLRKAGQWCIGASLGLYFSPPMMAVVWGAAWLVMVGVGFALLQNVIASRLLLRWGGVDLKTAWFASSVGGASEMSTLAERYGAQIDKVVSAHSLRVLLVVITIPFAFQWLGLQGADEAWLGKNPEVHGWGLAGLVCITVATAWFFQARHWINPWVFGPLLAAALLTLTGTHWSAIPQEVQNISQMLIGWSLGCKFGPDFFKRAPQFLAVVAVCNVLALLAMVVVAALLSVWLQLPIPTLILSLAPGGITEMTITAKVLHLGVPIVTVAQLVRMVVVLLLTGPLYHWQQGRTND